MTRWQAEQALKSYRRRAGRGRAFPRPYVAGERAQGQLPLSVAIPPPAEFDRPERVVVVTSNTMMDIDTTYVFTGANGGTRLVVTTDVRPKGPATVLSPLLRLFLRRELAKKYQTVKQVCEGERDLSSG